MKLRVPFLVVVAILLLCTLIVKAQELNPFSPYKSVSVVCRVPAIVERIKETVNIRDSSVTIQTDTLSIPVVIQCFCDNLMFGSAHIALCERDSKKKVRNLGKSMDTFHLSINILTLKLPI